MASNKTVVAIALDVDKQIKKKILKAQKRIYLKTGLHFFLKNNPDLHINLLSGEGMILKIKSALLNL